MVKHTIIKKARDFNARILKNWRQHQPEVGADPTEVGRGMAGFRLAGEPT